MNCWTPKQIVKEGLSEYFIFSIEGTETIPNGWSKRLRALEAASVPYRFSIATARRNMASNWSGCT